MWDFFCIVARKTCNDLEQITSGVAMVKPKDSTYPLQYNSGSPRFKLYNEGSQGDCEISMHIHAYICMRAFHKIHTREMRKKFCMICSRYGQIYGSKIAMKQMFYMPFCLRAASL